MKNLKILLAEPRGFCAGVVRAIETVEAALALHGPPVYVRHAIVHNETVVHQLEDQGAVFIERFSEIPAHDSGRPVVLSAHGSPRSVIEEASQRRLIYFDAICPLVLKVHLEVARLRALGFEVILIGHAGHVEVTGTLGQLPPNAIHLVGSVAEANALELPEGCQVGYVTQTTLSMFEVDPIVDILQRRFPGIKSPPKSDICYATTNRQNAVMDMVKRGAQAIIVVGSTTSSNTKRLAEVARSAGCAQAFLTLTGSDIRREQLDTLDVIGITAGASAPESDVEKVLAALRARFDVTTELVQVAQEKFEFKLPAGLRS